MVKRIKTVLKSFILRLDKNPVVGPVYQRFARWYFQERYSPEKWAKKHFKDVFGRELDLNNPQTLNEKIQWLKLYYNVDNPFYTQCADKYGMREYVAKEFGEEYLVPLLYNTKDWRDIKYENIPDCHCIVKANHTSAQYFIIRDKDTVDFEWLRKECKSWLKTNYYKLGKEWQYKNIERRIIVEKLLETKSGKIPNDYKLHFINGEFQFIYVSYDREGLNDRCLYDENWNRLPFVWLDEKNYKPSLNSSDVPKPETFEKMLEFGKKVAQNFKYVRVDFYDVDGKLYFGEITLHHGGGFDKFFPEEYDLYYGKKLDLN